MPIQPGAHLGPYEIVSFIGAGGMGEVYRARDERLKRDVAIKVLPEDVTADPEQRARFEREGQAVAALSHPNILAIFDTGSHEGRLFAVTELLEGQTLRDRLAGGPLPVRKAVDWAVQIAQGLAAAHDQQLVHRDLKPENVFLTDDGRVKILDFGLAKAASGEARGDSVTVPAATGAGVVLGTVGYMAPEQVRGEATDARTDLFAFGAVLYEMLTGQRAFRRDTAAETMTAILRDEPPDATLTRGDLPPGLWRIVRHCLEKQPKERFQSARDVAFALDTLSGPAQGGGTGASVEVDGRRPRPTMLLVGIGIAAAAVVTLVWLGSSGRLASDRGGSRSAITIGAATQITADDGLEIDAALSPDGKLLAYSAGPATAMRIYIRPVAGGRILTLSEGGAALEYQPRWSPDGSQILFLRPDGVFVASALGGTARRIVGGAATSAAWSPDGTRVLVSSGNTLAITPIEGGGERTIATSGAFELHSCVWAASTDLIACVSGNVVAVVPGVGFGNIAPSALVMMPATGGSLRTIVEKTSANLSPAWSPDGKRLYFVSNRGGPRDIYVMDIPPDTADPPAPVRVTTGLGLQSMAFAAASGGLVYVTYTARANIWSQPIPAGGPVETSQAQALTSGSQVIESVRVSPDRRWLVYDSTLHLNAEIFRIPIAGGPAERLTTDPADDFAPDVSPDGKELAFHSWRQGTRDIYVQPFDGGPAQAVTATPAHESYPRWSPDGTSLAFVDQARIAANQLRGGQLFVVRRRANGAWDRPFLLKDGVGSQGDWYSNDALVYPADGGIELVAPNGRGRVIYAPVAGSSDPSVRSVAVSEDKRTLYFKSADADGRSTIWAVPATGGKPRLLLRFSDPSRPSIRLDFAAGAGRFFFTLEDRQADIWVAEVSRR